AVGRSKVIGVHGELASIGSATNSGASRGSRRRCRNSLPRMANATNRMRPNANSSWLNVALMHAGLAREPLPRSPPGSGTHTELTTNICVTTRMPQNAEDQECGRLVSSFCQKCHYARMLCTSRNPELTLLLKHTGNSRFASEGA